MRFFLNIFLGVFYSRAAVEFLQLVLCKAIKTVRTMNLKFVWSELHLISVRSQNLFAFATAVEAFVNTARALFNVNSLFIFLAFDAKALKNCIANSVVAKQNALALQVRRGLPF